MDTHTTIFSSALKQSSPHLLSPGWSLVTIANVGVPFLVVMDAYESVSQRDDRIYLGGLDVDQHMERISAVLELLEYWVALAQSSAKTAFGHKNEAFREISAAMASGRWMRKMEGIKQKIEMIPEASRSLLGRLHSIEQNIRYLV
jgi:hypothetical protein